MDVFVATGLAAFRNISTTLAYTTSGRFDPLYADHTIGVRGSDSPQTVKWINPETGEQATLNDGWFHCDYWHSTSGSSGDVIWQLENINDIGLFRLYSSSANTLRADYYNGTSWVTSWITGIDTGGSTLHQMDIHWTITPTTIYLGVYIDESLEGEATASFSGMLPAASFYLRPGGFTVGTFWSQFLVSDTNTIGCKVGALLLSGNGTHTAWDGVYTDVNDFSVNDADLISSDTTDAKETFTTTDIAALPDTNYFLAGLWIGTRGRRGTVDPDHITPIVRVSGTDYDCDYNADLNQLSFEGSINCFPLNPDTGELWTLAQANAAEPGYKAAN